MARKVKKIITVYDDGSTSESRPPGSRARARARGRGVQRVGKKTNPTRRIPYVAKFGRRTERFKAKNDAAALNYANGLLAAKVGRKPSSLRRASGK